MTYEALHCSTKRRFLINLTKITAIVFVLTVTSLANDFNNLC